MILTGTWYNRLGSTMTIEVCAEGEIKGTYEVTMGAVAGKYTMIGRYDTNPQGGDSVKETVLGWVICWRNESKNFHAMTTWSGQFYPNAPTSGGAEGEEEIVTMWILSQQAEWKDQWGSTQIGQDLFTRTKPTAEDVDNLRSIGPVASHPLG